MKVLRRSEIVFTPQTGRLWCAVVAILIATHCARAADLKPEAGLLQSSNPRRISIEISEDSIETLRASRAERTPQPKLKAQATVSGEGRTYTNVTVQLKGYTSFQPIDRFPSLTLNFSKLAPGQTFHGLAKLSLNNSLQDATFLHEKLSRELFAAAGVPVPRADYAIVSLNHRELGLYVVTEGFDKEFLKRHFKRTDGNLYEGGVLQDIDQPLQVNSGANPANRAGVQRLLRAAREPDPGQRLQALEAALDMDRFYSMVAMETILCHSDSYSMNRNNYRLYHDPGTDKMVFMPHGMDRVLGTHRSTLDLSIVPPALGLVARAVLSTTEGRRRLVARAGVLFTNLFNPERLSRLVREIDAEILESKLGSVTDRRFSDRQVRDHSNDADDVCRRIAERAAELKTQLAHASEWLVPPPRPDFDADGVARLDKWAPRMLSSQTHILCESSARNDDSILRLKTPVGPLKVSLHLRVTLPAGTYRLSGQLKAGDDAGVSLLAALLRQSTSRYSVERKRLDWRRMDFEFVVPASRAPEEVEFVCEVQSDSTEVWFDASPLRLTRGT